MGGCAQGYGWMNQVREEADSGGGRGRPGVDGFSDTGGSGSRGAADRGIDEGRIMSAPRWVGSMRKGHYKGHTRKEGSTHETRKEAEGNTEACDGA